MSQMKDEGGEAAYIAADVSDYKDVSASAKGAVRNMLAPGLNDKILALAIRPASLTNKPEPPEGEDNLNRPMPTSTESTHGGWGGEQRTALRKAGPIAHGIGALFVARRLAKHRAALPIIGRMWKTMTPAC